MAVPFSFCYRIMSMQALTQLHTTLLTISVRWRLTIIQQILISWTTANIQVLHHWESCWCMDFYSLNQFGQSWFSFSLPHVLFSFTQQILMSRNVSSRHTWAFLVSTSSMYGLIVWIYLHDFSWACHHDANLHFWFSLISSHWTKVFSTVKTHKLFVWQFLHIWNRTIRVSCNYRTPRVNKTNHSIL